MTDYIDLGPPELPIHTQREIEIVRNSAGDDAAKELRSPTTWHALLDDAPDLCLMEGMTLLMSTAWQAHEALRAGDPLSEAESQCIRSAAERIAADYIEQARDEAEREYMRGLAEGRCDEW